MVTRGPEDFGFCTQLTASCRSLCTGLGPGVAAIVKKMATVTTVDRLHCIRILSENLSSTLTMYHSTMYMYMNHTGIWAFDLPC